MGTSSCLCQHRPSADRSGDNLTAGLFNDVLGGWRNEQYSVFGPPGHTAQGRPQDSGADEDQDDGGGAGPLPGSNVAFTLERAACALFGFATFGVHMTAYTDEPEPRVWVPRRSATKQTWVLVAASL